MDWDCEFQLKRILFNGTYKRILCQNENGPCPLLAIANILILKNILGISTKSSTIPASRIIQVLANILIEQEETRQKEQKERHSCNNIDNNNNNNIESNINTNTTPNVDIYVDSVFAQRRLEQMHCVIDTLPSLLYGLDVNVRFTDIDAFEYTQQMSILDAFDLKLFHGWCIDPAEVFY